MIFFLILSFEILCGFFYASAHLSPDSPHCKGSAWPVAPIWESTALEHWFSTRGGELGGALCFHGYWGATSIEWPTAGDVQCPIMHQCYRMKNRPASST